MSLLFERPQIFLRFPALIAVQSKRTGGFSKAPYNSLNLGLSTTDVAEDLQQNRRLFFESIGIKEDQIASSHQVHDNKVYCATNPGRENGFDAVITNKPGLIAGVTIADCTPVLIYDSKNKAVAAIHAGWRGTQKNIVSEALKAMRENFGTQGKDCYAYIGTCISFDAFEVGREVAEQFDQKFVRRTSDNDKFQVDLKSVNNAQLVNFGLPQNNIEISKKCTVLNNDEFFSYRLEKGLTGRMIALIGMTA